MSDEPNAKASGSMRLSFEILEMVFMATDLLSETESKLCFVPQLVEKPVGRKNSKVSLYFLISGKVKKMEPFLGVSYKLAKSENFEEYMKAIGVGLVTRKIGNAVSPVVKLTEKDGVYSLQTSSTFKNQEISFQPGVEFDEETADGRKVKSVVTFDGNKMVHTQKGDTTTTIVREFTSQEMKAVFTVGDVVCTRIYEKVN